MDKVSHTPQKPMPVGRGEVVAIPGPLLPADCPVPFIKCLRSGRVILVCNPVLPIGSVVEGED